MLTSKAFFAPSSQSRLPPRRSHSRSHAPVVLITGASAGLGLVIAKRFLQESFHVVVTARRESLARFESENICPSDKVWIRPLDITLEQERKTVIEEVNDRLGGVDVLINNAGIAYRAVVEHVTEEELLEQMSINFRSPLQLIRLALPGMRLKREGRIINISSVGGMMAMPTMSIYSASKFALEGATEALWYEVRPWNIKVSLVEPGFVHSESFQNTRYTHESKESFEKDRDPYHEHYVHMAAFIAKYMRLSSTTPEKIAETVWRTVHRKNPPLRVPATLDAHLFGMLRRVLPRSLYHSFLYRALPHIRSWGPHSPK